MEYLRIDGGIILKWLLLKLLVMIGTTFSWVKVGKSDYGNKVGRLISSHTFLLLCRDSVPWVI